MIAAGRRVVREEALESIWTIKLRYINYGVIGWCNAVSIGRVTDDGRDACLLSSNLSRIQKGNFDESFMCKQL